MRSVSSRMSWVIGLWILLGPSASHSQQIHPTQSTLDGGKRTEIIEAVIAAVDSLYIARDRVEHVIETLRGNLRNGAYDRFSQLGAFIEQVTADLQSESHDLHMGVYPYDVSMAVGELTAAEVQEARERDRFSNFGFRTVRRLPGNIGLLELSDFYPARDAGGLAVAALRLLGQSDALIVDLRRNGGGSGDLVNFILGHFFDQPVLTTSVYSGMNDQTYQGWTPSYLPGPEMAKIPIFVLVSSRTASAAEHFSYALKARGRATIVGRTTRGAANPIESVDFPELSVTVEVPAYKTTDPVTGTNWEGTGVEPDILSPPDQALFVAARAAAIQIMQTESNAERRTTLEWASEMYAAQLSPIEVGDDVLGEICGEYEGSISVVQGGGRLLLVRPGRVSEELIPLGDGLFAVRDTEWRIRFVEADTGNTTRLYFLYPDGRQSARAKMGRS